MSPGLSTLQGVNRFSSIAFVDQFPIYEEFYYHSSKVLTHFIKVAKGDENQVPLFIKTTL